MVTITLSEETEARLKRVAKGGERGLVDYALMFIEKELTRIETDSMLATFRQWEQEHATNDPEEIEKRQKEWEELKEGLNRNRLEMEGPDSRKIFP